LLHACVRVVWRRWLLNPRREEDADVPNNLIGKFRVFIGLQFVAESADCRWYQAPQFLLHLLDKILNVLAANDANNRLAGSALFSGYFPDRVALDKPLLNALNLRCWYQRATLYGQYWYEVACGRRRARGSFQTARLRNVRGIPAAPTVESSKSTT